MDPLVPPLLYPLKHVRKSQCEPVVAMLLCSCRDVKIFEADPSRSAGPTGITLLVYGTVRGRESALGPSFTIDAATANWIS
jgi:hypothetical protein